MLRRKIYGSVLLACALFFLTGMVGERWWRGAKNASAQAVASAPVALATPTTPWVGMPAGARTTYIGIHGGTVPVSLLTARDGQSMLTLVGRTGNDFLRTLRPAPAQRQGAASLTNMPESNATVVLAADTAIGSVPVFYCTGQGFGRMDVSYDQWQPFGLSERPLLLEGQVVKPMYLASQSSAKKYRRVLWQQGKPVLSAR